MSTQLYFHIYLKKVLQNVQLFLHLGHNPVFLTIFPARAALPQSMVKVNMMHLDIRLLICVCLNGQLHSLSGTTEEFDCNQLSHWTNGGRCSCVKCLSDSNCFNMKVQVDCNQVWHCSSDQLGLRPLTMLAG